MRKLIENGFHKILFIGGSTFYIKKNMADLVAQHEANKQKMAQADKSLDILVGMTGTMVTKAGEINTELKDQNQMIDKTNEKMDTADEGIVKVTEKVNKLANQKSSIVSWIIAALELIALIIILVI